MSRNSVYTRTSLLAIFFLTLHITDDVIRKADGADQGGFGSLFLLLVIVVWLYGILWLTERKSGYIISLIISFLMSVIPVAHLTGLGGDALPGQIATSSGPFFVWVVWGLGVTVIPSLVFSAVLLFSPTREKTAAPNRATVISQLP
ncbi:MAG TPA: hypothetical protein VJ124_26535 [Pyrinomonadaceae bacterium]|nr:hypothetical protein [Pyrinomonadaceae bacterium]